MKEPTMWKAIVPEPLRQPALEVALDVAERLRDPERAVEIARQGSEQSGFEYRRQKQRKPFSVVDGHAALALLFGQLDRCFPGQGWDRLAHTYLVPAARSLEVSPVVSPCLFGGLAGLCFVIHYLFRNGTRYQRLLGTLDELLFRKIIDIAVNRLPDPFPGGVTFSDYDVISGPAGVGAYLLLRREVSGQGEASDAIINRLIFLSERRADGHLRFFVPPEWQPTERHLEQNPHGATDCGLAHGVPGPLAFLALARLHGLERPGLSEAVRRLADWVVAQQYEDDWGINWPYAVPPDGVEPLSRATTRAAWCYGSPGVARALWLAGCALEDSDLQDVAVEAMRAVRRRPIEVRRIDAPILCHGVAGLLQVVLRFANDTGDDFFAKMATELTEQLLDLFEPDSLSGFRDIEPDGRKVDNPGLLEGAAGAALTLLAAATDVEPAWDRMFLLS
ncbi:MAG: lanthionine synthetase C family protein [Chloroflexota bacterium]|nr:lanthionine synthetase C family protein [Chloroflexota bacterium]